MTNNVLQQVQTYNDAMLAKLQNSYAFISKANKRFQNFQNEPGQLGQTVGFGKQTRYDTKNSLVISSQPIEQRLQTLTVDKEVSVAWDYTTQEFIYNLGQRGFMEEYGNDAIAEIGSAIETDVAKVAETDTYRFFGDGSTPITQYSQLADAIARMDDFGAPSGNKMGFLPVTLYPGIVNSGLNQFVPSRNEKIAMSWMVGEFAKCDWYKSNLLPVHDAGNEGINGSTLTVVSTTKDANGVITAITFSGTNAASDPDSVKQYDSFQFSDGVGAFTNLRFKTFVGNSISESPVQFAATADAASSGGSQVTVQIKPGLNPTNVKQGDALNINTDIVAGMQGSFLPSHRCGLILAGRALFLAMPRMPATSPFDSAISTDPESGCSIRTYYGERFGENLKRMVHDQIWGKTMIPEYSLKVALPL